MFDWNDDEMWEQEEDDDYGPNPAEVFDEYFDQFGNEINWAPQEENSDADENLNDPRYDYFYSDSDDEYYDHQNDKYDPYFRERTTTRHEPDFYKETIDEEEDMKSYRLRKKGIYRPPPLHTLTFLDITKEDLVIGMKSNVRKNLRTVFKFDIFMNLFHRYNPSYDTEYPRECGRRRDHEKISGAKLSHKHPIIHFVPSENNRMKHTFRYGDPLFTYSSFNINDFERMDRANDYFMCYCNMIFKHHPIQMTTDRCDCRDCKVEYFISKYAYNECYATIKYAEYKNRLELKLLSEFAHNEKYNQSATILHKALMSAYYQPGATGYLKAYKHFKSLQR